MGKIFLYHIETISLRPLHETRSILNRLGNKGWELITIVEERYYFKKHYEDIGNTSAG